MKRFKPLARAFVSLVLSIVMTLGVRVAPLAAIESDEVTAAQHQGLPEPVTVVRELEDRRTQTSKHYLLSNGAYRAEISEAPLHFKGPDGKWQDIDTDIVPGSSPGEFITQSAEVKARFRSDRLEGPVRLEARDYSVGFDLLGADEDFKLVYGNKARYLNVAEDTSLEYESLDAGVKETILLGSETAPNRFTFMMTLEGLELRQSPMGGWSLHRPGEPKAELELGELVVFDSSSNSLGEPAFCRDATMTLEPVPGGALVKYEVSEEWLRDPARKFPVKVDPSVTKTAGKDTYVASAYPTSEYGTEQFLKVGMSDSSNSNKNRAFVWFDVSPSVIPAKAYVDSATFSAYMYHQYYVDVDTMTYLSRLTESFSEASTNWNNQPSTTFLASQPVGGRNVWVNWNITSTVQDWVNGETNYGLRMYQYDSQDVTFYKIFRSSEYPTSSLRPKLVVNYSIPKHEVSKYASSYRIGDTAYVQVLVRSAYWNDINDIRTLINYTGNGAGNGSTPQRQRGYLRWSTTDPDPGINDGVGWESEAAPGGYVSYYANAYGSEHITLLPSKCSYGSNNTVGGDNNYKRFVFAFRIDDSWGDVQDNDFDTLSYMSSGWSSGWRWNNTNFDIQTEPITSVPSVTTTASTDWFTETDADADGVPDIPNDTLGLGRGSVTMTWTSAPRADGYRVYMHDGSQMRLVDSTTSTAWSSCGKALYPTDSAIAGMSSDTTANPFEAGSRDLRDDANGLYKKTAGMEFDNRHDYLFKIVPYDDYAGDTALSENATICVTLDKRTIGFNDDVRHVRYPLGKLALDDGEVQLDTMSYNLSSNDLRLSTFGPEAALTRYYSSSRSTQPTLFGPGWRFGFEKNLLFEDASTTVFVDERGERHPFKKRQGQWTAPRGFYASLTETQSAGQPLWQLTFNDLTVASFDDGGRLTEIADKYGQATTYTFEQNSVTITAANHNPAGEPGNQTIRVSLQDGKVTTATLTGRDGGTKQIEYSQTVDANGNGIARVRFYQGTAEEHDVDYGYSGHYLSTIVRGSAQWEFIRQISPPGLTLARPGAVGGAWLDNATVILRRSDQGGLGVVSVMPSAEVSGSIAGIHQEIGINRTGTEAYRTNPGVGGSSETWRNTYSGANDLCSVTSPSGYRTSRSVDSRGNRVWECDESGNAKSRTYNSFDQMTQESDAAGGVSDFTYGDVTVSGSRRSGAGPLVEMRQAISAGEFTQWTGEYDDKGRLTAERSLMDPLIRVVKFYDYSHSLDARPSQTRILSEKRETTGSAFSTSTIRLSDTEEATHLITSDGFSEFGEPTLRTLPSTSTASAIASFSEAIYSPSGKLLSWVDEHGAVTHKRVDRFGNALETSKTLSLPPSSPDEPSVLDWAEYQNDEVGRVSLKRLRKENGTLGTSVSYKYDAFNRLLSQSDSVEGTTTEWHDPAGRVVARWEPDQGVSPNEGTLDRAERWLYDAEGRLQWTIEAGKSDAHKTVYERMPSGLVGRQVNPDGSWVSYQYDGNGRVVRETQSSDGPEGESSTTSAYDLAGRRTSLVSGEGLETRYTYDLGGRVKRVDSVSTMADGTSAEATASVTNYNEVGWPLTQVDADGVTTRYGYDAIGNTVAQTRVDASGTVTASNTSVYAGTRLVSSKTSAWGNVSTVDYEHDGFGRVGREHQRRNGESLRDLSTTYDEFGRELLAVDAVSGLSVSIVHAEDETQSDEQTIRLANVVATSVFGRNGLRESQSATVSADGTSLLLSRVTDWNNAISAPSTAEVSLGSGSWTTTYRYDSESRLTSITGGLWGSGGVSASYDQTGTASKLSDCIDLPWGGTVSRSFSFTDAGRVATVTVGGRSITYKWNAFGSGELESLTDAGMASTFTYSNGRLATKTTGGVKTTYSFDASGRRTKESTTGGSVESSWTGDGNLLSWTKKIGSSVVASASYTYNSDGQRQTSVVFDKSPWSPATSCITTYTYIWDNLNLLRVTAKSQAASATLSYFYDELDRSYAAAYMRTDQAGLTTSTVVSLMLNDHSDVVALADAAGNQFARYRYGPFGESEEVTSRPTASMTGTLAAEIASANRMRWSGYDTDPWSSWYYVQSRYYDPSSKQFISRDPALADGQESAYQYCSGDPIQLRDSSGNVADYDGTGRHTRLNAVTHAYYHTKNPRLKARLGRLMIAEWRRELRRISYHKSLVRMYAAREAAAKVKNARTKEYARLKAAAEAAEEAAMRREAALFNQERAIQAARQTDQWEYTGNIPREARIASGIGIGLTVVTTQMSGLAILTAPTGVGAVVFGGAAIVTGVGALACSAYAGITTMRAGGTYFDVGVASSLWLGIIVEIELPMLEGS